MTNVVSLQSITNTMISVSVQARGTKLKPKSPFLNSS